MSVHVSNIKSKFATLKYDQLLTEKYFIETCFSKKYESISKKEDLRDMFMHISTHAECRDGIKETVVKDYCEGTTSTTTTTTIVPTTSTTTSSTTTTSSSTTTTTTNTILE